MLKVKIHMDTISLLYPIFYMLFRNIYVYLTFLLNIKIRLMLWYRFYTFLSNKKGSTAAFFNLISFHYYISNFFYSIFNIFSFMILTFCYNNLYLISLVDNIFNYLWSFNKYSYFFKFII